jgi:DNA-directed RNA polymerase I, II, and III subunit RPABC2
MADEFRNEDADYDEGGEEEMVDGEGLDDVPEEELTENQRAEAADLVKLFKQHPEIWIPYETSVREKLNTRAPGAETGEVQTSLRALNAVDSHHRTYPFLTQYERTKCISFRASQINNGGKPYILVPEGVTDSYVIAKMELEAKRLPFIMKRPLPDGTYEVWRLRDLVLL